MVKGIDELSEDERKALRGSKFAPLTLQPSSSSTTRLHTRMAHPGGPVTTNKAVALAKFLERKLQEPGGLDSLNPHLIEMAVKNAKQTVAASETSDSGRMIKHVTSFDDCEVPMDMDINESSSVSQTTRMSMVTKGKNKQKKKKKNKKLKMKKILKS
ncbi:hypothetical protein Droror1_Dr00017189 [Drosera rotundifolia]